MGSGWLFTCMSYFKYLFNANSIHNHNTAVLMPPINSFILCLFVCLFCGYTGGFILDQETYSGCESCKRELSKPFRALPCFYFCFYFPSRLTVWTRKKNLFFPYIKTFSNLLAIHLQCFKYLTLQFYFSFGLFIYFFEDVLSTWLSI